jgi:hypothetical protein
MVPLPFFATTQSASRAFINGSSFSQSAFLQSLLPADVVVKRLAPELLGVVS